jgi:flagellar assembly factor FliW
MKVQTTRFGHIEVDPDRSIRFEHGLLGFPESREFVLLQTNQEGNFFWLQSVDRAELAFVVCDPVLFIPDYEVPAKTEDFQQIRLDSLRDAQIFVVVNKVGRMLTGNLQGPLVINALNRLGKQMVLSEKKFSTRHPLIDLDKVNNLQAHPVSKTA